MDGFNIVDTSLAARGGKVLGVWDVTPAARVEGPAFDAPLAGPAREAQGGQRWEVNLSADMGRASRDLARVERRVTASWRALPEAEARLASLAGQRAAGVAFEAGPGVAAPPEPEAELLSLLQGLERHADAVNFGLADLLSRNWLRAAEEFRAGIAQLGRVLSDQAAVETRVEGLLVGQTSVGLAGNLETIWREGLDAVQAGLHQQALDLALQSRQALLRMLVSATRGAATLAGLPVLLATPGGALLALPMAWRFVDSVLSEHQARNQ